MRSTCVLVAALLAGCAAAPTAADWPADLPPRGRFVEAWSGDPENAARQSRDAYLGYVVQFYRGAGLVPGWLGIHRDLAASHPGLAADLESLARDVAAEWAKDNAVRRIDTRCLQVWGPALRAAKRDGRLARVLTLVRVDAAHLIEGSLAASEVRPARYRDAVAAAMK